MLRHIGVVKPCFLLVIAKVGHLRFSLLPHRLGDLRKVIGSSKSWMFLCTNTVYPIVLSEDLVAKWLLTTVFSYG